MGRPIHAYRCRRCDTLHYPFRMRCRGCGANEIHGFDPEPVPGRGTLVTYTHVHTLPAEYAVERLGLGIVELENGLRVLGQIDIDDPSLGMAVLATVDVVRREAYQDFHGMVFRAA